MKAISALLLVLSVATGLVWLLLAAFALFLQFTNTTGPSMAPVWLFVAGTALIPAALLATSRWLAGPALPGHSPSTAALVCGLLGAATGLVWTVGSVGGIIAAIVFNSTGGRGGWGELFGMIALAGLVPGALCTAAVWMHQTGR